MIFFAKIKICHRPNIKNHLNTHNFSFYNFDKQDSSMKTPSIINIKINEINKKYAYSKSIHSNEWNQIKELLRLPENQLIVRNECDTLLSACVCGPLHIIKLIYDISSIQIFHTDSNGNTPLHIACADHRSMVIEESIEVIRFLVESAPKQLEMTNVNGWLPLHYALIQRRNPDIIQILLSANPNAIYLSDAYGRTPAECFFDLWLDELEDNISDLTKMKVTSACNPEGTNLQVVFGTLIVILRIVSQMKKGHLCLSSMKELEGFESLVIIPHVFLVMMNICTKESAISIHGVESD